MWQSVCMCTHLQQRAPGHLPPDCLPHFDPLVGTAPHHPALLLPVLSKQVAPAKIDEACSKAAAGHYQLACAAAWEGKHGCACETGINHPNQVCVRVGDCRAKFAIYLGCCIVVNHCACHAGRQSRLLFLVRTAALPPSSPPASPLPLWLQYYEESRKALGELQENNAAAAAPAGQQQLPETPGAADAGRQLQAVLGSTGQQPGSEHAAKVQRTG